ncbi:MAG: class I SAM-dependent methyltransferase [Bacteroidetes bacterium]|nr:MAG: class I SAM-dependent methyltransferase [Bacteroidota bacterium]
MKGILDSLVRKGIDKARQSKYLQSVFEKPIALDELPLKGVFVDSFGNEHPLLEGLRTYVKPKWRQGISGVRKEITPEMINTFKLNGEIAVNRLLTTLDAENIDLSASKVMEVGCHSGGCSFSIAEAGAKSVTATEFTGFKVSAHTTGVTEDRLADVDDYLATIRQQLAARFSSGEKVEFVNDDICNSVVPDASHDVICSWDVLEHIHDPAKAIAEMSRILKPGGLIVHEYNSFFSLNGGHSKCTLDFVWGHARLSVEDFERYIDEFRPEEKDMAMSFFTNGLNRMTRAQLIQHLKAADFEILSIIPYSREQHARMVSGEVLAQVRNLYPDAQLADLVAPRTLVIAKKVG